MVYSLKSYENIFLKWKIIKPVQRQVYRQEGLRSFGRGYIPTVIGIFPYAGLDLFFAETARKYIQNTQSWAVNSGV